MIINRDKWKNKIHCNDNRFILLHAGIDKCIITINRFYFSDLKVLSQPPVISTGGLLPAISGSHHSLPNSSLYPGFIIIRFLHNLKEQRKRLEIN